MSFDSISLAYEILDEFPSIREEGGCCLHIVLDDLNLETSNVEFCSDYAKEKGHRHCYVLAELMIPLSEEDREQICNYYL